MQQSIESCWAPKYVWVSSAELRRLNSMTRVKERSCWNSPFSPAPPLHPSHFHHLNKIKTQQYYFSNVKNVTTWDIIMTIMCVMCIPWESSGGLDRALASSTSPLMDTLRFLSEITTKSFVHPGIFNGVSTKKKRTISPKFCNVVFLFLSR